MLFLVVKDVVNKCKKFKASKKANKFEQTADT